MITSLTAHVTRIAVGDCRDGILFFSYHEVSSNSRFCLFSPFIILQSLSSQIFPAFIFFFLKIRNNL